MRTLVTQSRIASLMASFSVRDAGVDAAHLRPQQRACGGRWAPGAPCPRCPCTRRTRGRAARTRWRWPRRAGRPRSPPPRASCPCAAASSAWPTALLILWAPVWHRSSRFRKTSHPSAADRRAARVIGVGRPTKSRRTAASSARKAGSRARRGVGLLQLAQRLHQRLGDVAAAVGPEVAVARRAASSLAPSRTARHERAHARRGSLRPGARLDAAGDVDRVGLHRGHRRADVLRRSGRRPARGSGRALAHLARQRPVERAPGAAGRPAAVGAGVEQDAVRDALVAQRLLGDGSRGPRAPPSAPARGRPRHISGGSSPWSCTTSRPISSRPRADLARAARPRTRRRDGRSGGSAAAMAAGRSRSTARGLPGQKTRPMASAPHARGERGRPRPT